jgi:hypothetical protein
MMETLLSFSNFTYLARKTKYQIESKLLGNICIFYLSEFNYSQLYHFEKYFYLIFLFNTFFSSRNHEDYKDDIVENLKNMLDVHNQYVKIYRMARDIIHESEDAKVQIKLIGKRNYDGRQYNLPTSSEVVVLIVGDIDSSIEKRDIAV